MTTLNRHGKKWTTPEILKLQREYELLSLPVTEIAEKHERTPIAIVAKLVAEEFITVDMGDILIDTITSGQSDTTSVQNIERNCLNQIWQLEPSDAEISLLVNELIKSRASKKTRTTRTKTSAYPEP